MVDFKVTETLSEEMTFRLRSKCQSHQPCESPGKEHPGPREEPYQGSMQGRREGQETSVPKPGALSFSSHSQQMTLHPRRMVCKPHGIPQTTSLQPAHV